jgi:cytochrome b561
MMAFWYLVLAVFLAVALNQRSRIVRVVGTAVAALGLVMMVSSIILADFDGTFAHMPPQRDRLDALKPLILNLQAIAGTGGILFLLWCAWRQFRRRQVWPLPLFNSSAGFGLISRYAHWMTAILILALIPMGLFMSILPSGSVEAAGFVAAHETMGVSVLILVVGRLIWLRLSPPAAFAGDLKSWERQLARAVHLALYGVILAFPLTGLLMMMCRGETVRFFGQPIPALFAANPAWSSALTILHDEVLQFAFYGIFFVHIAAVLTHHFVDRRIDDVRRMVR